MPILLDQAEAKAFLGLTDNAWREFVRRGIVSKVPWTDRYDPEELKEAPRRARELHERETQDNTVRLQTVQGQPEGRKKPTKGHASNAGWDADRAKRALNPRASGEGE